MSNVAKMFWQAASEAPDREAIICKERSFTWRELYFHACNLREVLVACGVKRNTRVGIYMPHCAEQAISIFSILMSDAVFTIVSQVLKSDQIKHQISDSDISVLVVVEPLNKELESYLAHRGVKVVKADLNRNDLSFNSLELGGMDTTSIPNDVACIIYTSGSTGNPKGVVVPHSTLLDGARIVSGYLKLTSNDVLLSVLPFGFDYGLNQLLSVVYTKAKIIISPSKLPNDIMTQIERYSVTGFAAVPSMWCHFFNPRYLDADKEHNVSSLRYITTAGGKHSKELLDRLHKLFPDTEIIIMYGLTESFRSTYLPGSEVLKRIGSIGKPVPEVEILVLNNKGEECTPGERGELYHRGAFVTYGYLNNDDLTSSRFVRLETGGQGCVSEITVRSGDIVSKDEDGYIYFHERADAQIKSSGYRVSPSQVEEVAISIQDIKMAAVYGMEDIHLGEMVCLAYSTYSKSPVDKGQMTAAFNQQLPSYAIPRSISFMEELPTTAHGKIDYFELKKVVFNEGSSIAGK